MSKKNKILKSVNFPSHETKGFLKWIIRFVLKITGIHLLDQEETPIFLKPFEKKADPEEVIWLPDVVMCGNTKKVFSKQAITTPGNYVWEYVNKRTHARILKNGTVMIGKKVPCTDNVQDGFFKNFKTWKKRPTQFNEILIAPWSQYIDSVAYGGYYDYLIHIVGKITRIKDVLPPEEFSKAVFSYPLFNTAYERDLLDLLEIKPSQVVDSRKTEIRFNKVILGNKGRPIFPHKSDLLSIKHHIEKKFSFKSTEKNRIYISRVERRVVSNENELIDLLKKFDFKIIEDKPRSIAEQVQIYKNASFIIGPHGASFSNIIWCDPGTHLLELFSRDYVIEFFPYMASLMGMTYSAYYYDNDSPEGLYFPKNKFEKTKYRVTRNMYVSIPEIEKCLLKHFKGESIR